MRKMGWFLYTFFSVLLYNVHLIFSRYFIMSLFMLLLLLFMHTFSKYIHFILCTFSTSHANERQKMTQSLNIEQRQQQIYLTIFRFSFFSSRFWFHFQFHFGTQCVCLCSFDCMLCNISLINCISHSFINAHTIKHFILAQLRKLYVTCILCVIMVYGDVVMCTLYMEHIISITQTIKMRYFLFSRKLWCVYQKPILFC